MTVDQESVDQDSIDQDSAAVRPHLVAFETTRFTRPVNRFVWEPLAVDPISGGDPFSGRRVLVLGPDAPLTARVAAALRSRGAVASHLEAGEELPVDGPHPAWEAVVDLGVTGLPYTPGDRSWRASLALTTETLQRVYDAWSAENRCNHHFYVAVTHLGGLMGYDDAPVPQPLGGVWAGFTKGLPRELPNVAVKIIDVDVADADVIAGALTRECAVWDHFEVGYRDGRRHALAAVHRPVGPARVELDGSDVVLISGGARGVGFALARRLGREYGARVVVTGRAAVPSGERAPEWLVGDEESFERWCRDQIASARNAKEVRDIRAKVRRSREVRTVRTNLDQAAREGVDLEYAQCDVTDAGQVRDLLTRLCPGPTVVVHNAGIDEPQRLSAKPVDSVLRTVDVKVMGFENLVTALGETEGDRRSLKVFCNVGSLAGRMGGMIGQIDYAAGNESLARLGFWARNDLGMPVQTVCWPTWERLGIIANYDAAVRYVSTLEPEEGVQRWLAELAAGSTDEAVFLGKVGTALAPSQLRGFALFSGHPDLPRLHSLYHYLGEVRTHTPFQQMTSTNRLEEAAHPCLAEFRVGGRAALPVSVLLEYLLAPGDWVVPPGWPRQHLRELRSLDMDCAALAFEGSELAFTKDASGAAVDGEWRVDVRIHRASGERMAAATLVYGERPAALDQEPPAVAPSVEPSLTPEAGPASARFEWAGLVFPRVAWARDGTGRRSARLPDIGPVDLWTRPFPPMASVAPMALEAIAQALLTDEATGLGVGRLVLCPGVRRLDRLVASTDEMTWLSGTGERALLLAEEVTVR